jgi:hypothetical protein
LSRISAGVFGAGNGTAGDYSGSFVGSFKALYGGVGNYLYSSSFNLSNVSQIYWSSTADGNGTKDTSISRCGGGTICFGNGTNGDFSAQIKAAHLSLQNGSYTQWFTSNTLTAGRNVTSPDGNSYTVMSGSLTTTAAASDNVTIQGITASGHCSLTATNASAAANIATTYISSKTANQITVAHTATAGMNYDVMCTSN